MPPNRRHYQVPGTPHADLLSPVIPADEEVLRSGRLPRVMTPEFIAALNIYPLEPTIIAGTEALIRWIEDGVEAPASLWFDIEGGALVRDEHGNATGGVRYGLIDHPLGTYIGAVGPGQVFGSMDLISAEEFAATYGTRQDYLALIQEANDAQLEAGYLTEDGADKFLQVANELLDRIGVLDGSADGEGIPLIAEVPEPGGAEQGR